MMSRRSQRERQRGKGNIYQASKAADGCNGREVQAGQLQREQDQP